jgi:hypothetical protein
MPAVLLCAQFTDQELALRDQARAGVAAASPTPPQQRRRGGS